jgi:hypothetical protein
VIDKAKLPRIFKLIRDDAPLDRNSVWEEMAAWNWLVLRARKFDPDALQADARRDLTFADLFGPHRKDYQFDLVHVRGRLIQLKKGEPTPRLTEAGVPAWYEGWLVPDDEARGHPVCVVITDLPPGLEPRSGPKQLMDVPVSFAGYSFKLMQYESRERKPDDPSKSVWKRAPLLIGRTVFVRADEDAETPGTPTWASATTPVITGGVVLLLGIIFAMSWWFRRGDRATAAELEANRQKNPFNDTPV